MKITKSTFCRKLIARLGAAVFLLPSVLQGQETWTQAAQLLAGDGAASDFFGWSVAISGDTAVVGAYQDNVGTAGNRGSAYVFVRSGGVWTQQQQLVASDGASEDQFGTSVAINGDTIVVGAPFDDAAGGNDQGSAYVFTRSGNVWTQQQQLLATGGAGGDDFGISVAISGETIVVGADFDDIAPNTNQGSAYVFTRSGGVWTQQAQLLATGGSGSDFFGISVAISGDTAVVGADSDDVDHGGTPFVNEGSAYVFTRSGSVWTQRAQLLAVDGRADDFFGHSVAISGNTIVVGAMEDSVGTNSDQGSAYVYTGSESSWALQAQLLATGGAVTDYFGISVAISGDTIVVGSNLDNVQANSNQGSAYVFTRSGTAWTEQPQLLATDGAPDDEFGHSVAISGDTIVVGAAFDDVGTTNRGSAYVFARPSGNGVAEKTLGNISTRLGVSTGENVLIGGFIVVGKAPKPVIIRAIGPTLGAFGVNGALADPTIELFQGSTSLAFNNNWQDSQASEISATGLAPTDPREAAIVRTLAPGAYTAIVRGNGDSTGIGLVDGYDLEQRPDSKLGNIATRGFVATGNNVLIAGFIVGSNTRVAVRAIGPSLAAAGISGPLDDPTLDLVNAQGSVIRANNNWKDSQQAEIEAIGIQPSFDRESALIHTLAAGSYTAIVRGVGNTTGVGVVEVYNLN